MNPNDLSRMIQDSLRDIPSDEDVSSGEDDPSILVIFLASSFSHSRILINNAYSLSLLNIIFNGGTKEGQRRRWPFPKVCPANAP